jgi:hypothetical protein
MNRKAAVSFMACLVLGGAAWCSEPEATDAQAPSVLPAPSGLNGHASLSDANTTGPATPSSVIYVSTPDSTPAFDLSFPNIIGGLQAGSSLATVTGGQARVPLFSRSAYTIGDNESPRPQDRIFFNYNYFQNANGGGHLRLDINRETFGVEKALFDDRASIGMRLPFVQTSKSFSDEAGDDLGDLSVVLKYAFINDQPTGLVLSTGLVITAPTGKAIQTIDGDVHSTLFQPYVGYATPIGERAFFQGFSSIIVPSDGKDTTLWTNTLSLGCWLYRSDEGGKCLRSIAPALEAQVATPLNHRDADSLIHYPDVLTMTTGVHMGLWRRSTFTVGASTPIVGPKPYEVGAVAQFNMKF